MKTRGRFCGGLNTRQTTWYLPSPFRFTIHGFQCLPMSGTHERLHILQDECLWLGFRNELQDVGKYFSASLALTLTFAFPCTGPRLARRFRRADMRWVLVHPRLSSFDIMVGHASALLGKLKDIPFVELGGCSKSKLLEALLGRSAVTWNALNFFFLGAPNMNVSLSESLSDWGLARFAGNAAAAWAGRHRTAAGTRR